MNGIGYCPPFAYLNNRISNFEIDSWEIKGIHRLQETLVQW